MRTAVVPAMVSIFVYLDGEPKQPVARLIMSAGQSSETANEVAFAVVVDPRSWKNGFRELADVIEVQLELLAIRSTGSPHTPDLTTRLRVGATTVAEDMEKEEARQLLDLLIGAGVDAKLSRRARRAVPPRVPKRPAQPLAKRDPQTPAERPSSMPAERQPSMRATLMDGWPQSLTASESRRDAVGAVVVPEQTRSPVPQTAESTTAPSPEPPAALSVTPSLKDDSSGPATVMGWGDFIRRPLHETPSSAQVDAASTPQAGSAGESPAKSPSAPERASDEDEQAPEKVPFPFGVDSAEVDSDQDDADPAPVREEDLDAEQPAGHQEPGPFDMAKPLPGRPVPLDELLPRPWLATLLSVLAPGGGQVYLGQKDDARNYALTAPLITPWVQSVRLANRDAHLAGTGRRTARSRPQLLRAVAFVLSLWIFAATIVVGSVLLYTYLTRPAVAPPQSALTVIEPTTAEPTNVEPTTGADGEPTNRDSIDLGLEAAEQQLSGELMSEVEQRRRQAQAARLVTQAVAACEENAYERCASLADEARELNPELIEAARLYHRATVALEARPVEDCSGSSDQDGCP